MIQKILVALDGSLRAPAVFDAAAEIAERFGATLAVLRVIDVPPEFPAAAAGSLRDALPELLTRVALTELDFIVLRNPRVTRELPLVRAGTPWRVILEVGDQLAVDLIVVGSHGYHGIDRVLGTTASRVADRATRSVMVVHERRAARAP